MNYQFFVGCGEYEMHRLEMDDAVIENWLAAMWEEDCPAMVFALPQMQCAILEWRANWQGPDKSIHEIENTFQDIHDRWQEGLKDGSAFQAKTGDDRLPGEWLAFHPIRPHRSLDLLEKLTDCNPYGSDDETERLTN